MKITPELINLDLKQIQYLIDLVSNDITIEKRAYDQGYIPYERADKDLPTQTQCQDHQAKAMEQHGILKQLYVIAQYSVLTEVQMYTERFGKDESEVKPNLCDEKKSNKPKKKLPKTLDSYHMQEIPEEMLNGFNL